MNDIQDIYGDGFTLGASEFGVTLILTLTMPSMKPGPQALTAVPVVRIRMSRELGKTLVEHLTKALASPAQAQTTTVKH